MEFLTWRMFRITHTAAWLQLEGAKGEYIGLGPSVWVSWGPCVVIQDRGAPKLGGQECFGSRKVSPCSASVVCSQL